MLTVFVFVMNVFSLPGVILICCSEFYFAVTVVGHSMPLNSDYTKNPICISSRNKMCVLANYTDYWL